MMCDAILTDCMDIVMHRQQYSKRAGNVTLCRNFLTC